MALGRGLSELLGEVETAYNRSTVKANSNVEELSIDLIKANPAQPRKIFDEVKLQELSQSIKRHGLIQPIVVIEENEGEYTLVAGERRLRASKLAGLSTIKAVITNLEELQLREVALIENIQRDDLNIMELAYSYSQLLDEHNITHEELSNRVYKSRSSITNTLRLLQLTPYVQQFLSDEKISAGHAKVLLGLSEDEQKMVANSVVGQKLNVRDTENLVKKLKNQDTKKEKKENISANLDFNILNSAIEDLNQKNLKAKVDGKFFKIEIKSQEDIEKIYSYFSNTL